MTCRCLWPCSRISKCRAAHPRSRARRADEGAVPARSRQGALQELSDLPERLAEVEIPKERDLPRAQKSNRDGPLLEDDMKIKFCPKCGEDISDTYEKANPKIGNEFGSWYCDACEL